MLDEVGTIFGDVVYTRTYFKNKSTGEYAYLCDERYGIEPHERLDMSLKAAIVEKSNDLSYAKSIEEFNTGIYSRSTVMNLIREMGAIENNYISRSLLKSFLLKLMRIMLQHNIMEVKWIKEGVNWIPKSVFVLDYFQLSKYIKTATAHMEYTSRYMWQYLKLNMKKDVNALFKAIIESTVKPSKKDSVITAKKYVMNNWEAIKRLLQNKK